MTHRRMSALMPILLAAATMAGCGDVARNDGASDEARGEARGEARDEARGEARGGAASLPDTVRAALVEMGGADQAAREGLSPERMQDTAFMRAMLRGDSARSLRLRAIVDRWGWPDSATAGPDAAGAAFLILQHSPLHEFREAMLPALEAAAAEGTMPASDVALLVDRVRVQRGEPQRYGTQFSLEGDRLVAHPVEDLDGLDARRRAMGLPPMAEYVRLLEEHYDAEVVGPGEVGDTAG